MKRNSLKRSSVVSELEGILLKNDDTFPYFMLVAFESSGLIRFASLLLFVWPVIRLLKLLNKEEAALKVTVFVATFGIPVKKIEAVARVVLPKFYSEDVDLDAWRLFNSYEKKVVVTRMPRVMVEWFVKEHLNGTEVIGSELVVNRLGLAVGMMVKPKVDNCIVDGLNGMLGDEKPSLGMAREKGGSSNCILQCRLLSLCEDYAHPSFKPLVNQSHQGQHLRPTPVIFHDGRLAKRPTVSASLLILLWFPFGILLASFRITLFLMLMCTTTWYPVLLPYVGIKLTVKGNPPPPLSTKKHQGVLFTLNHRTSLDPSFTSFALMRKPAVVTYSASPLLEAISPVPTIRLTRDRRVDAAKIKTALEKGDLLVCPEGTTCREPFLLRFSALFAELTDRIVPVAVDCKVGFFYATTANGWKALDMVFFLMNPRPEYRVTFLDQLTEDETCTLGNNKRTPYEVANDVQRKLAVVLGFQCTDMTRKDKYRLLARNDGSVSSR